MTTEEKRQALWDYCNSSHCDGCVLDGDNCFFDEYTDKKINKCYELVSCYELISRENLGTNKLKIKLDKGAYMPTRAHKTDAGLDLYARESRVVPAKGSAIFDTGVHIELPKGTVGMVKSKSGLNTKHGLTSEGVIDEGYTGSIVVKLYNNSERTFQVFAGQKISQLVILPVIIPDELEIVEELENSDRGNNGFGSSGV